MHPRRTARRNAAAWLVRAAVAGNGMGGNPVKLPILSAAIAAAILATTSVVAATELKLTSGAPPNTPWGKFADKVAEDVNAASAGKLTIKVFPSSQLGDEQTTMRQLVRGRLDLGSYSNAGIALIAPEFGLLANPYLWDSYKQMDCAVDNHLLKIFAPLLASKGVVLLTWMEVGNMILFAQKPVMTPADIKGIKVRSSPALTDTIFWREKGANAIPIGTADAMPALKTGLVSAGSFPTVYGIAVGFQKVAKYVSVTNHSHQLGAVVASKQVWDRLSPQEREWLLRANRSTGFLRDGVRGAEKALIEKIKKEDVPVHEPTAGETQQWKADAAAIQDKIVKETGGRSAEIWKQILEAKAACRD